MDKDYEDFEKAMAVITLFLTIPFIIIKIFTSS
jgi:hypothetical protein